MKKNHETRGGIFVVACFLALVKTSPRKEGERWEPFVCTDPHPVKYSTKKTVFSTGFKKNYIFYRVLYIIV